MTIDNERKDSSESVCLEIGSDAYDNVQELQYRNKKQPIVEPGFEKKYPNQAVLDLPLILGKHGIRFRGNILELGAGSCWFSSTVSKFNDVEKVYALDFSRHLILNVAPLMMNHLHARKDKIVRVIGSFYNIKALNQKFDFVVFESSLHHADNPIKLLQEVRKVLTADGSIVCVREPVAPRLPVLEGLVRTKFGAFERRYGVTENIYTLTEWKNLFAQAGLKMHTVALPTGINLEKKQWKNTVISQIPLLSTFLYGLPSLTVVFLAVPS